MDCISAGGIAGGSTGDAGDGVEVINTSDSPIIVNDFAELGAALD